MAIDTASVIVLVTDLKSGVVATDQEVAAMLQKSGKPIVLCVNKCDRPGDLPLEFYEFYNLGLGDPIAVSSIHGHGTGDLLDEVIEIRRVHAETPLNLQKKMANVHNCKSRRASTKDVVGFYKQNGVFVTNAVIKISI